MYAFTSFSALLMARFNFNCFMHKQLLFLEYRIEQLHFHSNKNYINNFSNFLDITPYLSHIVACF